MGRQKGDGHFTQESRRSEDILKSTLNDDVSTDSDGEVDDM